MPKVVSEKEIYRKYKRKVTDEDGNPINLKIKKSQDEKEQLISLLRDILDKFEKTNELSAKTLALALDKITNLQKTPISVSMDLPTQPKREWRVHSIQRNSSGEIKSLKLSQVR